MVVSLLFLAFEPILALFELKSGPVVKWYYAAFALPSRESDSPQVHRIGLLGAKSFTFGVAYSLGKN